MSPRSRRGALCSRAAHVFDAAGFSAWPGKEVPSVEEKLPSDTVLVLDYEAFVEALGASKG